jgi:glucose/arabinose dehydrogenase
MRFGRARGRCHTPITRTQRRYDGCSASDAVGRIALQGAVALLVTTSCVSGRPTRGIVEQGTAQPSSAEITSGKCRDAMKDVWAPPGFCVTRFASGLSKPRHMVFAPNGDLLVATREGIAVLWDADQNGESSPRERAMLGAHDLSQQGIALSPDGRFLYIADSLAVRRLPFHLGLRRNEGPGDLVIRDEPLTIDHPYRTLTFDSSGRLYLAVGADDNLTPGKGAAIMRYTLPDTLPSGGIAYDSGEAFAVGIRNAEALAWDDSGHLWAFVNGRDYLRPPGTPETFYSDHPGEWVYRLSDKPGAFYGFPNCWVLGAVPWGERRDPASQWADPDANHGHDDAWCQNPANVETAAGSLPAHTAPLGAVQYRGSLFPASHRGTFFVTSHGSWNRHQHQRGRTILEVRVKGDRVVSVEPFVGERASNGDLEEGDWSERPVGIVEGPDGALYVSSDETGNILRVSYAHD